MKNNMKNLVREYGSKYSVLGGVVAPKNSAYTIMGMPNPLMEKPTIKIDTTLPSLRDNGSVSAFNNFNPYGSNPVKSKELHTNRMSIKRTKSDVKITRFLNRFTADFNPVLNKKFVL